MSENTLVWSECDEALPVWDGQGIWGVGCGRWSLRGRPRGTRTGATTMGKEAEGAMGERIETTRYSNYYE